MEAKNAAISKQILCFIARGASVKDAINYVLGIGYYECLVEELYTELRAK